MTHEAQRQTRRLLDETRQQLRQQTAEQAQHVTQGLHTLGSHLEALVDGRPEEAGEIARYLQDAANRVHDMAGRVEELGPDGVSREVQQFARRRPGTFLLGAAAAGFAVARLGRGAAESDEAEGTASSSASDGPAMQTGGTTPYVDARTHSRPSVDTGIPPQTGAGTRDVVSPGTGEARR